jgi:glycosyltransferase involved in cell wall biosynthesis
MKPDEHSNPRGDLRYRVGMKPRVSVLLPYRDAAATIVPALESVLAEPAVDEVIAVDDGSRDDGAARAKSVQDTRIVHVRTAGLGVAGALSAALARARGELVARMDGDDVSAPGRIEAEIELLASDPSLAVAGCLVEATGDVTDGMRAYVAWQNSVVAPDEHARAIFVESPLCHPAVTMRRAALEAVGGFCDAPWAEDWDLWLRLDAAGYRLAKVPRVLFSWRQHARSVTRRDVRCSAPRLREARARYLAPRLLGMARPVAVWGAGPTGKRLARALEAHGVTAARFIDVDPRKIGRTRRGAPVVDRAAVDRGHTIVVAVGARGARDLVRADLEARGLVEGRDFVVAA